MRSETIATTTSSGTSSPRAINSLAWSPDGRARLDRCAQHLAGRELHQAMLGHESLRLRAFAGPRRAEQYQPHLRRPRSFDLLMRPSYWCANKYP